MEKNNLNRISKLISTSPKGSEVVQKFIADEDQLRANEPIDMDAAEFLSDEINADLLNIYLIHATDSQLLGLNDLLLLMGDRAVIEKQGVVQNGEELTIVLDFYTYNYEVKLTIAYNDAFYSLIRDYMKSIKYPTFTLEKLIESAFK